MVAVFTGNGLGLFRSSLNQLGFALGGKAGLGQSRESQYVNVSNGNLILQGADEQLVWQGLNVGMLRTYNSQGQLAGTNGLATDGFETGFERRVELTQGTLGQAGSEMTLWTGDGQKVVFSYAGANASGQPQYQSKDGSGADDTLSWSGTNNIWTWVEGTTRQTQTFADHADASLQGRLLTIADGKSGATFTVNYDANGRVSEVTAGNGDALVYAYDASGRLSALGTREAGTLKGQVYYDYDALGRLSRITTDLSPGAALDTANIADGNVFWTQYSYVGNGLQVSKVEQSDGVVSSYTYDAPGTSGRVKTVTLGDTNTNDADGAGQTVTFNYGGTLTEGGVTYTTTQVVDSAGRTWTYAYDSSGQLRIVQAPAVNGQSGVTHYSYDASGDLSQVTDAQGGTTTYSYDANGNLLQQTTQDGARVDRQYNSANQVICETRYPQTDANGNSVTTIAETKRYVYDASNRLRFVVDAAGEVTEYRYAAVGTSGVMQLSSTLMYLGGAYNLGNMGATQGLTESQLTTWQSSQDIGQITRVDFSYDLRGALAERRAYATVDAQGNGVSDAGLEIVRYTYDAQGLLHQQIEVRGANRDQLEGTSFVYDGMGRLVSTTDALNHTTTRVYDNANHQLMVTQANGLIQTQVYDHAGQIIAVTESAASTSETHTAQWIYDAEGQLRATQDASGARAYRFYDAAGHLQGEVDSTGAVTEYIRNLNGDVTQTIAYATRVDTTSWLANGQVVPTDLATVRPASSMDDRYAQATYDTAGRLSTQADAAGTTTTYTYDGENRLVQVRVSGSIGDADRVTRTFYDIAGRQVGVLDAEGYLTEMMYDRAGRQVGSVRYSAATDANLRATGTLDQLRPAANATADVRTRVFFDGRGNVIATLDAEGYLTESLIDEVGHARETRAYALQLTGLTGSETLSTLHTLAAAGSVRTSRMAYDALGQLTTQTNAEGTVTTYSYDAVGHLVRTDTAANTSEVRENNARYDVFGNLIGELGGEGSLKLMPGMTEAQLDAIYNQYGVTHRYDAVGRRIESIDANGNKTWYVYDAAGRQTFQVRGVADANGVPNGAGEVTETRYNAFGQVRDSIAYTGRITIATPGDRASVLAAVSTLQYVAALDNHQQFNYDTRGLMASRLDANGYLTRYSYTAFGALKSTTDYRDLAQTQAETTALSYDRLGRLLTTTESSSIDAQIRTLTQTWDAFNRVSVTDGRGNVTSYTYDRLGRQVTSARTVSGRVEQVRMAYDAYGRVTSQFDAALNETKFVYDDVAKSVTVTSPEGVAVTTVHNAFGQTVTVTDALNETTTFNYDHDGHLVSTKDAQQTEIRETRNIYDVRGLLHLTIDATGRTVELDYDAAGRVLTRVVDPDGLHLVTAYAYDGQGRQIQVTDPTGIVTLMKYDAAGQLVESTVDPLGLALKIDYTWDGLGRQLTVTEGAGTTAAHTAAYAYDGLGRRVSETVDPNGLALTTTYAYDGNDNVVSRTDAGGRIINYAYDAANRLIETVDGNRNATRMTYDVKGQLIATRSYAEHLLGSVAADDDAHDVQNYRVYDRDGRVHFTVDGAGAVCEYSYDAANRLTQTRHYATAIDINAARTGLQSGTFTPVVIADDAHDEITSQVYDAAGHVRFVVNAVGDVTESRYDEAGRVIETVAHATALAMTATLRAQLKAGMTDTALSNLVDAVVGDTRAQSFVYDGAGRNIFTVTRATVLGETGRGVVTSTQYDAAGRVTSRLAFGTALPEYRAYLDSADLMYDLSSASEADQEPVRATHLRYDHAGRLRFQIDGAGAVTESIYDSTGQVVQSKQYDALLSPVPATADEIATWAATQNTSDIRSTQFHFDNAGRLVQKTDALQHSEYWTYDGSGLKTSYTNRNSQIWTYEYDAAGRLTVETSPQVIVTSADANGQITQTLRSVVTRMGYDGLGNIIMKIEDSDGNDPRTTQYNYDNRGHQILTSFPDAGQIESDGNVHATGNHPTIEITYDALGRAVVEKDVRGNYRQRAYDAAGQLLFEVDQEGGTTGYTYNAFGEQVTLTRFAISMDPTGAQASSAEAIRTKVDIHIHTVTSDGFVIDWTPPNRVLTSIYDARGQKIEVHQSAVTWVDGTGASGTASPTTRYLYDAFGQLAKESVLQSGNPDDATADWAETLHYYDVAGRQIASVDANGYLTRMEYDAQGELTKQHEYALALSSAVVGEVPDYLPESYDRTTGFDRVTEFRYDALGRKIQETAYRADWLDGQTEVGVATDIEYDNEGHVVSSGVDGINTRTAYDALGRVVSVTEAERDVLKENAQDLLIENSQLRLDDASLYQKASPYSTMAYDAFGNVVQLRRYANGLEGGSSAADQIHTTRYDGQGRAVWERDEAGTVYTRIYDAADHIIESRFRLDGSNGRWSTVVTMAEYDRTGRQISSVVSRESHLADGTPAGTQTDSSSYVSYTVFGEIESKAESRENLVLVGLGTHYSYDKAGRLTQSNDDGILRGFGYDLAGNQTLESHEIRLTDGYGVASYKWVDTQQQFDHAGHLVRVAAPTADDGTNQAVTLRNYDRWGNVVQEQSPTGAITTYNYNELDQVIRVELPAVDNVEPDGSHWFGSPVTWYVHDTLGRLAYTQNDRGAQRSNLLNEVGQIVGVEDATQRTSRVAYNALGEEVLAEDGAGYVTFKTYDNAGRVTEQGDFTTIDGVLYARTKNIRESYTLNQNGNRLSVTDALGNVTHYDYDSRGLVLRSRSAAGMVMDYAYDLQGHKIRETNGLSDPSLLADGSSGSVVQPANGFTDLDFTQNFDASWTTTKTNPGVISAPEPANAWVGTAGGPGALGTVTFDQKGQRAILPGENVTVGAKFEFHGNTESTYDHGIDGQAALTSIIWYNAQGQQIGATDGSWLNGAAHYSGWQTCSVSGAAPPNAAYYSMRIVTTFGVDGARIYTAGAFYADPRGTGGTVPAGVTTTGGRRTRTDANSNTVYLDEQTWKYDIYGRLIDHHDLGGIEYISKYDPYTGQQYQLLNDLVVDENGQPTSSRQIEYYANGQVKAIREGSNYTQYTYDLSGNRTSEDTLTHDGVGQIHLRTTMKYDGQNRLVRVTQTDLNVNPPKGLLDLRYEYDSAGNRVHVKGLGAYGATQAGITTSDLPPIVVTPLPDAHITIGNEWTWSVPAGSFQDPEGAPLTLSAKLADGSDLPGWLSFDGTQFIGTAPDVESIVIRVTAKDVDGNTIYSDFTLTSAENQPPQVVATIPDQTAFFGAPWSLDVSSAFADPEGQPLHFDGTTIEHSALPAWLSFNPVTGVYSGTPPQDATSVILEVIAYDPAGEASARIRINLTVQQLPYPGFSNLDFNNSPSTDNWNPTSTGPVVAQHIGYIGTGAHPGTVTITQGGKRAISAGQQVSIGAQFEFHGYNSSTQGHGVAGEYASGSIVWYDAAGNEISTTAGTALDGAVGYVGYTQFSATGNAPTGAAFYSMRFSTSFSMDSAEILIDNAFYADPNGSGGAVPANVGSGSGGGTDPDAEYSATEGQQVSWLFYKYDFPSDAILDVYEEQADGSWLLSNDYAVGGTTGKNIVGVAHAVDGRYDYRIMVAQSDDLANGQIHTVSIAAATTAANTSTQRTTYVQQQAFQQEELPVDDTDPGWEPGSESDPTDIGTNTYGIQDFWYSYDGENRLEVAHGKLENGQVVLADNMVSFELTYDEAGRAKERITRVQGGADTDIRFETTTYDERGNRLTIVHSGESLERYGYDAVGRQINHSTFDTTDPGNQYVKHVDITTYDADGRVTTQTGYGRGVHGGTLYSIEGASLQKLTDVRYNPYDAAGRMTGYGYTVIDTEQGAGDPEAPHGDSLIYAYTYEAREGYLEKSISGTSANSNFKPSTSYSTYDDWGRRTQVLESTPNVSSRTRTFAYDMEGNILQRSDSDGTERYVYVQGQNVANGKSNGKIDVISQLTAYQTSEAGTTDAEVQAGDTLQSIARRVYGNSNLWYVLAEANAISLDTELVAGTTLKVPQVQVTANDATTFKPFNPNEAIGNTAPNLPYIQTPPKQHCNTLLMIIIVVVAVIVTIYTAGAAATAIGAVSTGTGATAAVGTGVAAGSAAAGGTFATGVAALAGGYGTTAAIVAGAVGGAAGSIASQAVGSAMGVTQFSWKNVAVSAIAGGLTAGLASELSASSTFATAGRLNLAGRVVQGVGAYGSTVLANAVVGNQTGFSWKGVAASAIGAFASAELGGQLPTIQGGTSGGFFKDLASGFINEGSNATAQRLMGMGKQNWDQIAADAFGNALGNAIVGGIQSRRAAGLGVGSDSDPTNYPLADYGDPDHPLRRYFVDPQDATNGSNELGRVTVTAPVGQEGVDWWKPGSADADGNLRLGELGADGMLHPIVITVTGQKPPQDDTYANDFMAGLITSNARWTKKHDVVSEVLWSHSPNINHGYTYAGPQPGYRDQAINWLKEAAGRNAVGRTGVGAVEGYLHTPEMIGGMVKNSWDSLLSFPNEVYNKGIGRTALDRWVGMVHGAQDAFHEIDTNPEARGQLFANLATGKLLGYGLKTASVMDAAPVITSTSDSVLSQLSPEAQRHIVNYQASYDFNYAQLRAQLDSGELVLPGHLNENAELGNLTDKLVRADMRMSLANDGLAEGRGQAIQVNRNFYDPSGSGDYVRPDFYLRDEGIIVDGTIGVPKSVTTSQMQGYINFAKPNYIIEIGPNRAPRIIYTNPMGQ